MVAISDALPLEAVPPVALGFNHDIEARNNTLTYQISAKLDNIRLSYWWFNTFYQPVFQNVKETIVLVDEWTVDRPRASAAPCRMLGDRAVEVKIPIWSPPPPVRRLGFNRKWNLTVHWHTIFEQKRSMRELLTIQQTFNGPFSGARNETAIRNEWTELH